MKSKNIKHKKQQDQNIYDFVLTNYGDLNYLNDFLKINKFKSTQDFENTPDGTVLLVNPGITNATLNQYNRSIYIVKTGILSKLFYFIQPSGITLTAGDNLAIEWRVNNDRGFTYLIDLFLYQNNILINSITTSVFSPFTYPLATELLPGVYQILGVNSIDTTDYVFSDTFTVLGYPYTITLTSSTDWYVDATQTITWTSDFANDVRILIGDIDITVPNTGTYDLVVAFTEGVYPLRIEHSLRPDVYDEQNITVIQPIVVDEPYSPLSAFTFVGNQNEIWSVCRLNDFGGTWQTAPGDYVGATTAFYPGSPDSYVIHRIFFWLDCSTFTGTILNAKLYLKRYGLTNDIRGYILKGTNTTDSVDGNNYDNFAEVLTTLSTFDPDFYVFTFNTAGVAYINQKPAKLRMVLQNARDYEDNPTGLTNEYISLTSIGSYMELTTTPI